MTQDEGYPITPRMSAPYPLVTYLAGRRNYQCSGANSQIALLL